MSHPISLLHTEIAKIYYIQFPIIIRYQVSAKNYTCFGDLGVNGLSRVNNIGM